MAVQCAKCGEELLGSVNRCWRCGSEFEAPAGVVDEPPVRRRPIAEPLAPPLEAILVGEDGAEVAEAAQAVQERWSRRGSPFAESEEGGVATAPPPTTEFSPASPAQPTNYPVSLGAVGGATAAIMLAGIGFVLLAFYPAISLLLAAIGVGFGIWGLQAPRRAAALIGLILCCVAFTLSAIGLAYGFYVSSLTF